MRRKKSLLPPRKQPVFRQIESDAGRENIASLLLGSGNPRASRLLDMMGDPVYAGLSFGRLCSRAGLSGEEVIRLIIRRQIVEGLIRMAYHLPAIMEDVTLAALDHNVTCMKCAGNGHVSGALCANCHRTGEICSLGDIRARRLVFKILGILPHRER